MKTQLLILFCFCFNLVLAQNNPSPKSSATIQVGRTDNSQASIKSARTSIQDLNAWIDHYEWELNESSKTTGVSPGAGRSANLNMSKSNRSTLENPINNSRSALKSVAASLDQYEKTKAENLRKALSDLYQTQKVLDKAVEELHKSILERGEFYTDKTAELKEKHEAIKSSINNIRS